MKPNIRMTEGEHTVWDTGFGFVVAPVDAQTLHPHINVAVQAGAVRKFPVLSTTKTEDIDGLLKQAWDYCNELNEGVRS